MLADAGVSDPDSDGDNVLGCALGRNGQPDPTFPLLVLIALAYLTRRKWLQIP